jgi:hypothetical protein
MEKNIKLILFIVMMLSITLVNADEIKLGNSLSVFSEEFVFKQNEPIDFKIPCFNNNTYCSSSTGCNLTVKYPNLIILIDNKEMTNKGAYFNYSINETNQIGTYYWDMVCTDGSISGYGQGTYKITQSGIETGIQDSITHLILVLGLFILSFFLIFFSERFRINGDQATKGIVSLMLSLLLKLLSFGTVIYLVFFIQQIQQYYPALNNLYDTYMWLFIWCSIIFFILYFINSFVSLAKSFAIWKEEKKNERRSSGAR